MYFLYMQSYTRDNIISVYTIMSGLMQQRRVQKQNHTIVQVGQMHIHASAWMDAGLEADLGILGRK